MAVNRDRETPIIIIRKRGRHNGHHGGAWKVALADFMTAMFALFLVLWLVNQSSDVKAAIAGYFQDPLGRAKDFGSSIIQGEGAQTQMARPLAPPQVIDLRIDRLMRIADRIKEQLGRIPLLDSLRNHIEITMTEEGLRIELLEDSTAIFFQSGRAELSERGRLLLGLIGQNLASEQHQITVEGHTDAQPYASQVGYTNWELSADRANSARRILTEAGVGPPRFQEIRGMADRRLRYPDAPLDPRNRRISVLVLLDRYLGSGPAPPPTPPGPARQ